MLTLGVRFVLGVFALVPGTVKASTTAPSHQWTVRELTVAEQKAMTPSVWRKGCPVALTDLRRVTVTFINYSGKTRLGQIDVHRDYAEDIAGVFKQLFETGFRINKVRPVEAYGGSDDASIDDDNTSAFNCRNVTGGKTFSEHAYGRALDLNPYRNPYVKNGKAQPRPGIATYVNRKGAGKLVGVITSGGPAVAAFNVIGWEWGGNWKNPIDYQHFSSTGK